MPITILKCLLFFFVYHLVSSVYVFQASTVFYSQLCFLGSVGTGSKTFTCTTTAPQNAILRTALSFSQFNKAFKTRIKFISSVSYGALPTSSFTLNTNIQEPSSGMRLSFFLVIVKSQTPKLFVDLMNFQWGDGSKVDNGNNNQRTETSKIPITPATIFSSTTGLVVYPFTTHFSLRPQTIPDDGRNLDWKIQATVNSPNITLTLTVQARTQLQWYKGFAIIINQNQITTAKASGLKMDYVKGNFKMNNGNTFNLASILSLFGPKFNGKCLVGLYHITVKGDNLFGLELQYSAGGSYQAMKQMRGSSMVADYNAFCYGQGQQCSQTSTWIDTIDSICYTAPTCPLPVPSGWTLNNLCPICTQLACSLCTISNRSNCQTCKSGVNVVLSSGSCNCLANYYQVTFPISTSSKGQWNNVANSLTNCKINCTLFIPGCKQDDCLNDTFCTTCQSGFMLDPIDASHQLCATCPDALPNCITCNNIITCTKCADTFYLDNQVLVNTSTKIKCSLCSAVLTNCVKCTDGATCTSCLSGYKVDSTSKKCVCDPVFNSLAHCKSCTASTACDACNVGYYVSSATFLCEPCSNIHVKCTQCSDQNSCTKCGVYYALDSGATLGKTICTQCIDKIPNCDQCTSLATCTNCGFYYGLTTLTPINNQCQLCNTLVMSGCQSCEDNSLCLTCDSTTRMIKNICHYCNEIYKCFDCFVTPADTLQCTVCQKGFIIFNNPSAGQKYCKPCINVIDFCYECDSGGCLSCVSPYLLGPSTRLCDQCLAQYQMRFGFCVKYPGCQSIAILANGDQVCIACIQALHFVLDTKKMQCICENGYVEYNAGTKPALTDCIPVCGDGILLSVQNQQCDDKNIANNDGCSKDCKKQPDYVCSTLNNSPSVCTLVLNIQKFQFNYAYRYQTSNKGTLSFTLVPKHYGLQKVSWNNSLKFNFSSESVDLNQLRYQYTLSTGQLKVTVPYSKDLQQSILQTQLSFDPDYMISQPSFFLLHSKLNGVNAPLIIQNESLLSAYNSFDSFTHIIIYLLLAQFYIGSYVHKMIGLETIQIIQVIYFSRVAITSSKTKILNSINSIRYSAGGFEKYQLFFEGTQGIGDIQSQQHTSVSPQFSAIGLRKYFLMNTNFSLILLVLVVVVYAYKLLSKFYERNKFVESRQQSQRDKYIEYRRSSQWIYDHFFFPYIMMLNLLGFFNFVLFLQSTQATSILASQSIQEYSYPFHVGMLFFLASVYCFQIFNSYEEWKKYTMKPRQRSSNPQSLIEMLEYDGNNPDRANYHPIYVLVYSMHYLSMQLSMVLGVIFQEFQYSLQLCLGISIAYFIIISKWKPYHQLTNIHNHFLKLNHGTVVVFFIIGLIFKSNQLEDGISIAMMSGVLVLITIVTIGGFVRIFFQRQFRNKLQYNNVEMYEHINQSQSNQDQKEKQQFLQKNQQVNILSNRPQIPSKKSNLLQKNQYSFENQLKKMIKQNLGSDLMKDDRQISRNLNQGKQLTESEKQYLISKIRNDYSKQKENIILEEYISDQLKYQMKQPFNHIFQKSENVEEQFMASQITKQSPNRFSNFLKEQQPMHKLDKPFLLQPQQFKNKASKIKEKQYNQLKSPQKKNTHYNKEELNQLQRVKKKLRIEWKGMSKQ